MSEYLKDLALESKIALIAQMEGLRKEAILTGAIERDVRGYLVVDLREQKITRRKTES